MKITLVGMGMGNPDTLTRAAWSALEQAQRMIGARRHRLISSVIGVVNTGVSGQTAAACST